MRYLILLLLCLSCATESDVATWGTDIKRDATVRQTGGNSIQFNEPATGAIRSDYRPVIPGHPYRAFASIRDDDNGGAGDKLHLYIEWFTSAKVSISTDDVWPDSWPNTVDAWAPVSVIADAPATAAFCQLIAEKTADDANGSLMWVDHFEIEPFPYAFHAYIDGGQTIESGGGGEIVVFATVLYEYGECYASPTFTAPVDGFYNVKVQVPLSDGVAFNGAAAYLTLLVDGGGGGAGFDITMDIHELPAGRAFTMLHGSTHIYLLKGQTLEIHIIHSDGQDLSTSSLNNRDCHFAVKHDER